MDESTEKPFDLSIKDGENIINARPHKRNRRNKSGQTRRRISYDPKFIKMVSRLVAAGHDANDVAFIIGVKRATIDQWKHRYPVFRKAWDEGKKIAGSYLIATGLKLCEGYEAVEETLKFSRPEQSFSDDGMPIPFSDSDWVATERKTIRKPIPPNAQLIQFFLAKLCPEVFSEGNSHLIAPTEMIPIAGPNSDVSDSIRNLAGKLSQLSNSPEPTDAEFESPPDDEEDPDEVRNT